MEFSRDAQHDPGFSRRAAPQVDCDFASSELEQSCAQRMKIHVTSRY